LSCAYLDPNDRRQVVTDSDKIAQGKPVFSGIAADTQNGEETPRVEDSNTSDRG
jgi:hypothetical protein